MYLSNKFPMQNKIYVSPPCYYSYLKKRKSSSYTTTHDSKICYHSEYKVDDAIVIFLSKFRASAILLLLILRV